MGKVVKIKVFHLATLVGVYDSQKAAAKALGFSDHKVRNLLKRKGHDSEGYRMARVEDPKKKVCLICGNEFEQNSNVQKYCSRQCCWKAQQKKIFEDEVPYMEIISNNAYREPDETYLQVPNVRPKESIEDVQRRAREKGLTYGQLMAEDMKKDQLPWRKHVFVNGRWEEL